MKVDEFVMVSCILGLRADVTAVEQASDEKTLCCFLHQALLAIERARLIVTEAFRDSFVSIKTVSPKHGRSISSSKLVSTRREFPFLWGHCWLTPFSA